MSIRNLSTVNMERWKHGVSVLGVFLKSPSHLQGLVHRLKSTKCLWVLLNDVQYPGSYYHGNKRGFLLLNLLLNPLLYHISYGDIDHLVFQTKASFGRWLAVFFKNSLKAETLPFPHSSTCQSFREALWFPWWVKRVTKMHSLKN